MHGFQCGGLARWEARAYIWARTRRRATPGGRWPIGEMPAIPGVDMLNAVHPAQVAGSVYPAEPEALRALIAEVRTGGATRWRRRAESGRRPARRHRLFRLGRRHRLRAWARRASRRTDRHCRPGPSRGLQRARDPSGLGLEHAARRGEGRARPPCPACRGAGGGGRRAAVRWRAFARDASRDAAGDAAGPVRNPADPGRRRDAARGRRGAAAGLGRTGDGHRDLVRPVAFSRSGAAPARSTTTRPGGSRPSTSARSRAGGPAAISRSAAR